MMPPSLHDAADNFYAACNLLLSGDPAAMQEIWAKSDDISQLGPTGTICRGRQAVMEQMARESREFAGSFLAVDRQIVETPDMGYVVCSQRSDAMALDGRPIVVEILATTIFRRENGHWRVVHNHTDRL